MNNEAHDNSFCHSGWLHKYPKNRSRGAKRRRFFILANAGALVYYESVEKFQEDEARIKKSGDVKSRKFQKGEFTLTAATTITRYYWAEADRQSKNVIRLQNEDEELLFEGESDAHEDHWIEKVEALLKELF